MAIFRKDGNTPAMEFNSDSSGRRLKHTIYYYTNDTSVGVEYRMGTWSGLPKVDDLYQFDENLVVSSVRARPVESSEDTGNFIHWYADIEYAPPSEDNGGGGTGTSAPDQINWGSVQYEIAVDKAYSVDGTPTVKDGLPDGAIQSTTDEVIPASKIISNPYVTITTNQNSFNPDWIGQYENTIISKSTRIAGVAVDKGQARMLKIGATNQVDNEGNPYFQITMEIEINKEGFNFKPMNVGYYRKDGGTKKLILKKDISDEPAPKGDEQVDEPAKIDSSSRPIKNDTAFYRDFQILAESAWGSLPIPQNF